MGRRASTSFAIRVVVAFAMAVMAALLSGCRSYDSDLPSEPKERVSQDSDSEESQSEESADVEPEIMRLTDDEIAILNGRIEYQTEHPYTDDGEIVAALRAAQEANPNVCAWLYVPGTNISLPILQHPENDYYYMNYDQEDVICPLGSLFIESGFERDFSSSNTVIYGHSFSDNNVMFTELHEFEDKAFFDAHDRAYVYTDGAKLIYTINAATIYSDAHIQNADLLSEEMKQSFLDFAINPGTDSGYVRDVSMANPYGRIIQLSTCTIPANENLRFVVAACLCEIEELSNA